MSAPPGHPELAADRRAADLVFWVVALVLVFWALGAHTLHGSEDRWAEVTREMFLRRDFFHPTINGSPYFDKPLGGYWLVALVSMLTGRLDEWALRLPAAIAGVVVLWATIRLGRRLWSPAVGRTAGWLLLTTYGFIWWIKRGEADMENLAAITSAMAWYWYRRDATDFGSYLVFYLICFVGAQTKGLTAIAVPAVALAPDVLRGRRWRRHLNLANVLALGAGLVVYLAPFIYETITRGTYGSSGLVLVFRENIERYVEPFDHVQPFYVYFYDLPELFLPWVPLLLVALASLAGTLRRPYDATRWLAEALVLVFLFFTLSGSRRGYYILPCLPLCALATALFVNDETRVAWRAWAFGAQKVIVGAAMILALGSPALWRVAAARLGFAVPLDVKVALPVMGALALAPLLIAHRGDEQLAPLMAATVVLFGGFTCWMLGRLDDFRTQAPFARELGTLTRGEAASAIAFYRPAAENVLFYANLPVPVRVFEAPESMSRFVESGGATKIVVVQAMDVDAALQALPADVRRHPTLAEAEQPWENPRQRSTKLRAWKITPPKDAPSGEP